MVDHYGHAAATARKHLAARGRGGGSVGTAHDRHGTCAGFIPERLGVVHMKQIAARGMRWSVPGLRQQRQARGASGDESGDVRHFRDHHHFFVYESILSTKEMESTYNV